MNHRGFIAWGIQTGPFAACWANFVLKFFQLFTFILGAQCLWHSNWTICSLLSQFCSEIFPTFDFHTWCSVPGAFKLDHLQPIEPILFWNVSYFWFSYLVLNAWGIKTGSFAACWANFVLKLFTQFAKLLCLPYLLHLPSLLNLFIVYYDLYLEISSFTQFTLFTPFTLIVLFTLFTSFTLFTLFTHHLLGSHIFIYCICPIYSIYLPSTIILHWVQSLKSIYIIYPIYCSWWI